MCGIFGLITPGRPVKLSACFRAVQSLRHRGPDGLGISLARISADAPQFFLNPSPEQLDDRGMGNADVFLGHRRLSVIDLSAEAFQPMGNEDKGIWILFNGEIYNHLELRQILVSRGHQFVTHHSDTEAILHGYEEWGEGVLGRMRGMFAFAVVDFKKRKLFFARDRFGEKPIYITFVEGGIAFASELKAFEAGGFLRKNISKDALCDYLRFGYVPAPKSIYTSVTKLEAAESAVVDFGEPDRLRRSKYWELTYSDGTPDSKETWREKFFELLSESIRMRLPSDVPLGAFLSGGLDSTTVIREMARSSATPPRTFNIAFGDPGFDESRFAQSAANRYKTEHHTRLVSQTDLLRSLPDLSRIFDEPFADASALPTIILARMARESVTVALSGDGGDELLAGYSRYALNKSISNIFDRSFGRILSGLIRPIHELWPERVRGKGLVRLLHPDPRIRYESMMGDGWLIKESELDGTGGQYNLSAIWDEETSPLVNRMCKMDAEFYIPEDLMVKVDRATMAVSLESRAPLLDHQLFEFVASSPVPFRFDGRHGKLPFRDVLAEELSPGFVSRKKQGFAVPSGAWFRNELRKDVGDILCQEKAFVGQFFRPGFPKKLIDSHVEGTRDQSHRIWTLMCLELWHRRYGGTV